MEKNLEYYLNLPYTREFIPDPTGGWDIRIKELPGCISQGETPEEAMRMIEDAMRLWLTVSLEDGDLIPEPRLEQEYSGKFVARVPKSLHRKLVETAEQEGVSLNQLVSTTLAALVGDQFARPVLQVGDRKSRYTPHTKKTQD
jgi:antitoxin HicB